MTNPTDPPKLDKVPVYGSMDVTLSTSGMTQSIDTRHLADPTKPALRKQRRKNWWKDGPPSHINVR